MRFLWLTMRMLLVALIVLTLASPAGPPATISLSSAEADRGETTKLSLVFTPGAEPVSGIQFDLAYDGALLGLQVLIGEAAGVAGKNLFVSDLDSNTKRVLLVGVKGGLLPEGTLVDITATASLDVAPGVYPLALSNVVATTPDGNGSAISGTNGVLTVKAINGDSLKRSHIPAAGRHPQSSQRPH